MRVQTLLNRKEKFKSFVYGRVKLEERSGERVLLVRIRARKRSRPRCSECGACGPVHDHLDEREFEYVPFWGFLVFFVYRMRRVKRIAVPPFFLLTRKPAKSVYTDNVARAFCLDAFWFVDGASFSCGPTIANAVECA